MNHLLLALLSVAALITSGSKEASAQTRVVQRNLPVLDQAGLQTVGVPKPIIDPSGVRLSVLVNSTQDQPKDFAPGLPSGKRWLTANVSVTNVGTTPFILSPNDFLLFSSQTNVLPPALAPEGMQEQLTDGTLDPGATASGQVLYSLAAGVILQAVMFQAPGMSQWLVAILNT